MMRTRVVVNSSTRAEGSVNSYKVVFPTPLKDVCAVTLVACTIPFPVQTRERDTLYVDGVAVKIPEALSAALPEALSAALPEALSAALPDGTWAARVESGRLRIECSRAFAVTPGGAGLRKLLGLRPSGTLHSEPQQDGSHAVRAPFRTHPPEDAAVVMFVDGMHVVSSNDPSVDKAFAVIPCRGPHAHAEYRPNAPMARVQNMRVSFTRLDGTPFDFNNEDHVLQFDFHHGIARQDPVDPVPQETDSGRTDLGRTDLGRTDLGRTDLERFLAEGMQKYSSA